MTRLELNSKNILISIILFIIIDSIYLSLFNPMFNNVIKNIQGNNIKLKLDGAIYAYICIVLIFNYFIIYKKGKLLDAFMLGFLTYGIFEGTNRAIFSNWTINVMLIDSLWGGILFSLVFIIMKLYYKEDINM
tara:strand:- start:184 stop:582 length:399 start_codon:yes stop_codon:yes gene_type:complete